VLPHADSHAARRGSTFGISFLFVFHLRRVSLVRAVTPGRPPRIQVDQAIQASCNSFPAGELCSA
jgi:hypothetical protein